MGTLVARGEATGIVAVGAAGRRGTANLPARQGSRASEAPLAHPARRLGEAMESEARRHQPRASARRERRCG